MTQRSAHLWLLGASVAVLAALGGACLPGGLLPKRGGACGKALCECAPEPGYIKPTPDCCQGEQSATPAMIVFAHADSKMRDGTPTIAFQLVWHGLLKPAEMRIPNASAAADYPLAADMQQWHSRQAEIPTPPPRS